MASTSGPGGVANKGTKSAQKLAFAKRGGFDLVALVARDDNETKIDSGPLVPAPAMYAAAPDTPPTATPTNSAATPPSDNGVSGPPPAPTKSGCGGCRVGDGNEQTAPMGAALTAAIAFVAARLRRRSSRH